MNNFTDLNRLIEQHFNSYLAKPIVMKILDTAGTICFITHYAEKLMSLPNLQIAKGVNFVDALTKSNYYPANNLAKLETILSNVSSKKKRMTYLMSLKTSTKDKIVTNNVWHCVQSPLLNPMDDLIGIQIVCTVYNNTPLENLFYNHDIAYDVKLIHQIGLTAKQHYALFLLCNNFTQEEIAAMFQVTRGTITRMIVDQIAPKLGVIVANASNVIIKAKQIGFQYQLPFNLFGDTIVIINDHENME